MASQETWANVGDKVLERITALEGKPEVTGGEGPSVSEALDRIAVLEAAAEPRETEVGDIVLYCRAAGDENHWLPLLVTNVHDLDTVSGVLYSGFPKEIGIDRRGSWLAQRITRGEEYRNWKPR